MRYKKWAVRHHALHFLLVGMLGGLVVVNLLVWFKDLIGWRDSELSAGTVLMLWVVWVLCSDLIRLNCKLSLRIAELEQKAWERGVQMKDQ
jgi:hypothetical protein